MRFFIFLKELVRLLFNDDLLNQWFIKRMFFFQTNKCKIIKFKLIK